MTVECDAILLGREAIHGTANASVLAALVKNLSRKSFESRKRYILRCGNEFGVQMIPFRCTDDEGFESDEDLISLGSYDESTHPSGMYVTDNATKIKHNQQKSSSQLPSNTNIVGGSISSIGTDSANSSGGSDNDDNEPSHRLNENKRPSYGNTQTKLNDPSFASETYQFHEIAFCHTDPSLPKVIVWVVKTKKKNKNLEFSYGLEAIVFYCRIQEKFRDICRCFQELSRRSKLDKPLRHQNRWSECNVFTEICGKNINKSKEPEIIRYNDEIARSSKNIIQVNQLKNSTISRESENKEYPEEIRENSFNLIQRVDTDGVTHIEVSRPAVGTKSYPDRSATDTFEPSNIISINTPESGNIRSFQNVSDNQIESIICADVDVSEKSKRETVAKEIPERPERKKDIKKNYGKDKAPLPPEQMKNAKLLDNHEKVVRGHFVRVSVDQSAYPSSPVAERSGRALFGNEARPCGNTLSYHKNNWTYAPEEVRKSHRSQQTQNNQNNRRSKSSGGSHSRRSDLYPMSHRYVDAFPVNNSLPNRFFDKIKELTIGSVNTNSSSSRYRRRNSIGELANSQFYQYVQNRPLNPNNRPFTKSTPNLKSVIKNKNGKLCKEGTTENSEPKKVTFSAYATVQVVD